MKHSKQAHQYLDSEHIRFLTEDNRVPTIEQRILAAFDAGRRSVNEENHEIYANHDITFPNER